MDKNFDIIIPCFNESRVIGECVKQLENFNLKRQSPVYLSIILVDDGSTDNTWKIINSFTPTSLVRFKRARLSRNFGHQSALFCGFGFSTANIVGVIDADLQDPVPVLFEMFDALVASPEVDVFYGQRITRAGESFFKKITARVFYRIVRSMSESEINIDAGDFRVMRSNVIEQLLKLGEYHIFTRGLVPWVGFNQQPHQYDRAPRFAGETKYTLAKMLRLARNGIFSFSLAPLHLLLAIGAAVSFLSVFFIVYSLFYRIFGDYWVPGWTLMFTFTSFLLGVTIMSIAIVGQYVGLIFEQVKGRPLYIISETKCDE
ncbi:glycosyltransferase family 2 protein [Alphaproteobacteria bacterium]|nr:glycosyltransferase family 2 protein [Alphaproteobacteria bacterium]